MVRCCEEEDSEVPISLIKSLSLACESITASSSKANVCSLVFFGSSIKEFGNGESPLLLTLPSLLAFSEEKILSMPSLPASHHAMPLLDDDS